MQEKKPACDECLNLLGDAMSRAGEAYQAGYCDWWESAKLTLDEVSAILDRAHALGCITAEDRGDLIKMVNRAKETASMKEVPALERSVMLSYDLKELRENVVRIALDAVKKKVCEL